MKIVKKNQQKIVIFTAVNKSCILHGRVFARGTCNLAGKMKELPTLSRVWPTLKPNNESCFTTFSLDCFNR